MTIRIGILGAAQVATYAMIGAAAHVPGVTVRAVAARDPARAAAYAEKHGIARVYPDYRALIEADDIDAVYVALPPSLHAQWSIAALEAGKPVLCEKPFALSVADAEAMLAAEARAGLLLMEAQHSHYHPMAARMRDMAAAGDLGAIEHVHAMLVTSVPMTPSELRYQPAVGGGALWDLGAYPAYWARSALDEEPNTVLASQRLAPTGADIETIARLGTPSGAGIILYCSMDAPHRSLVTLIGSRGRLDIENPLMPQRGHLFRWHLDGRSGEETFEAPPTYVAQLIAFRDALCDGIPVPTRGENSLGTIRLLADIQQTARRSD